MYTGTKWKVIYDLKKIYKSSLHFKDGFNAEDENRSRRPAKVSTPSLQVFIDETI